MCLRHVFLDYGATVLSATIWEKGTLTAMAEALGKYVKPALPSYLGSAVCGFETANARCAEFKSKKLLILVGRGQRSCVNTILLQRILLQHTAFSSLSSLYSSKNVTEMVFYS